MGGPSWIGRDGWVIEARPGENRKAPILNLYLTQRQKDDEEFRMRIQSLLADRFQLKTHKETREEQVYTLVVAKTVRSSRNRSSMPAMLKKGGSQV
jgi:uncharacterized protein (TIGR03435 family)